MRVWHFNDAAKPADAVYIGRAMTRYGLPDSHWRNVYSTVVYRRVHPATSPREARLAVIEKFRLQALDIVLHNPHWLPPLRGHDLVCWCAKVGHPLTADDPLVCHGQVLLRLLEGVVR